MFASKKVHNVYTIWRPCSILNGLKKIVHIQTGFKTFNFELHFRMALDSIKFELKPMLVDLSDEKVAIID